MRERHGHGAALLLFQDLRSECVWSKGKEPVERKDERKEMVDAKDLGRREREQAGTLGV